MKNLEIIRNNLHLQFLHTRNFNNLIQSDDFEVAYNAASKEERKKIWSAIERNDKRTIRNFITNQILKLTPFEKLGIRKLRDIGSHLQIKNYYNMTKFQLVEEIKDVAKRLKETSQ